MATGSPMAGSQDPWQHLLFGVGVRILLRGQVRLPALRIPDLKSRVGPDYRAVPLDPRVGPQRGRAGAPAPLVGDLVGRTGEAHAGLAPTPLGGARRLAHRLSAPRELPGPPRAQAPL